MGDALDAAQKARSRSPKDGGSNFGAAHGVNLSVSRTFVSAS
jgi:hypothetical protein